MTAKEMSDAPDKSFSVKCTQESILSHCLAVFDLWGFVFQSFAIHWVVPRTITDLLFGKHSSDVSFPLCSMWRKRNGHTFKNVKRSRNQLLASFTSSLFNWSSVWVSLVGNPLRNSDRKSVV